MNQQLEKPKYRMNSQTRSAIVSAIEKVVAELETLARTTATEVGVVSRAFEGLTNYADTILTLATAIVASVESESVNSVLPQVRSLNDSVRIFIADRLRATTGVLDTVTAEVTLLRQLSRVTRGQRSVAFKTQALSVLANMEAARLGHIGVGFQQLARELSEFSNSLSKDTQELARHTDDHRTAIEETAGALSGELPRLREKLAAIEKDLANNMSVLDSNLNELSSVPAQFRTWVEDIAKQITGVVAAVQAHDITRQQIEHVQEAFGLICAGLNQSATGEHGSSSVGPIDPPSVYAGLTIQVYQLRAIKETVANWTSQIKTCMEGILQVSASQIVGIGPAVLQQEREVSLQLAHIERLEHESQAYSDRIQHTFGGLSSLVELVSDHVQRSKSVRDCLQLLTFNSIIEATRLGGQAKAILAIARGIEGVAAEWGQISGHSEQAMQEISRLVDRTNLLMEVFSEAGNEKLREAQIQSATSLSGLRTIAAFAAGKALEMKNVTERMKEHIANIDNVGASLDACHQGFDAMVAQVEWVKLQCERDSGFNGDYDASGVEQIFSSSYTTEFERDVLRAALYGAASPVVQTTFAGNSVELF